MRIFCLFTVTTYTRMARFVLSKVSIIMGTTVCILIVVIYHSRQTNRRKHYTLEQSLKNPGNEYDISYSQARQDKTVYEIFPMEHGFFIEMGAFDGQRWSNTLWLERKHGWTGLLIEADPDLCDKIDKLHRQVWRLCGCISEQQSATFIQGSALGGIADHLNKNQITQLSKWYSVTVPCYKLQNVLDKLNNNHINYFSLDVEGAELIVLETIKESLKTGDITVDIWTIEYRVWDGKEIVYKDSMKNLVGLRNYFKEIGGYVEHSQLSNDKNSGDGLSLDVVFVNIRTWCDKYGKLPNGGECS